MVAIRSHVFAGTALGIALIGCAAEAPLSNDFEPGYLEDPMRSADEVDAPRAASRGQTLPGDHTDCDPTGPWERNVTFEAPLIVGRDQSSTIHALSVVDRRFILWRSGEQALQPRLATRRPVLEGRLRFEARGEHDVWALTVSSADEPLRIDGGTRAIDGRWVVETLTSVDEDDASALPVAPLEVPPHVVVHQGDLEGGETYVFAPYPSAGAREFRAFHGRGGTLVELPRSSFEQDGLGGGFVEFTGEVSLALTRESARGDWHVAGTPAWTSKRRLSSEFELSETAFACLEPKERRFRLTKPNPERQFL